MEGKKFLFSVIIPVYNVENYLEDCLLSVINQTIGFKKNIQIILVNDESPDNSGEICEKYKAMYPENIVYIEQKNTGVSGARNKGLEYVEGKYVNFIDSDDKWGLNVFKKIYKFFEKHYDEIDVAATGIRFFEAKEEGHMVNCRLYPGTRVADLTTAEEREYVTVQVASSFFKADAIRNHRFVEGVKLGEDSLFVNSLILEKMKVGFVKDTVYYYRRRIDESSAVQNLKQSKYFFIDRLETYHLALIKKAIQKYGKVPPYIQNVIYYDFGFHLYVPADKALPPALYKRFLELCKEILSYIDDSVILGCRFHAPLTKKLTAMRLKYGTSYTFNDNCVFNPEEKTVDLNGQPILTLEKNKYLCDIILVKLKKDRLIIEGRVPYWLFDLTESGAQFFFRTDVGKVKPKFYDYVHQPINTCIGIAPRYKRFSVKVPLNKHIKNKSLKLRAFIKFKNGSSRVGMNYSKFIANTIAHRHTYTILGDYCMVCFKGFLKLKRLTSISYYTTIFGKELRGALSLFKKGKANIASLRIKYWLNRFRGKYKDEIWLISDRVLNAGDNGEVFFKYASKNVPKGVRPIFAISRDAACVDRLKSEGEVVFFEDKEYKMLFLFADKIISSGASDFTMNPFLQDRKYLVDLFRFKYYYLQHGVACADLSGWLNRYAKNLYRIFASSEKERQGFLNADYYYGEKQIVVAGQARFDDLYNDREKLILILPTWRKSIKASYDINTTSVYYKGFRDTEYFKHYNNLINDARLLEVMRKHGYKGLFCMHPIHKEQTVDYTENDVFKVNQGYVDYNDVFARAALTLTDYSSVLFDFAYLRKPVIYTQFDKEEFFSNQTYDEGYFSYEQDGFGPVCYDYDSTVDALINAIENDCQNSPEYLKRADRFFAFNDKENSRRIFEEIINS